MNFCLLFADLFSRSQNIHDNYLLLPNIDVAVVLFYRGSEHLSMSINFLLLAAYNSGRGATSQELIYQHMSNHYRRILNAKKVVDTSPPYCYKQKRPGSAHLVPALPTVRSFKVKPQCLGRNISPAVTARSISTNSCSCTGPYPSSRFHASCVEEIPHSNRNKKYQFDKRLIDRITYDTKNGPSAYW